MKKASIFLLISSVLFFPTYAFAVGSAGFENASFSAKSLGESNAVVAQADEPAAISYNPAGIVDLPGLQVQSNANLISAFTFQKSPSDAHVRSAGTIVPIPTGYITLNPGRIANNRLAFGIGSDSPFGLSNKYDSNDSMVHYTGWRNALKMYTIKPTAAIKLADWLSLGGGPVYYRVFNFAGIQAYPNALIGGPTDGQVRLNLAGNTWGWQFGALLKPHKQHQFGFYFRSPVTVFTRGRIKVENAFSTVNGNPFFETGGNAKLDLPLNFTWGYAYKPTDKTTIETDFGFTRWAAYKRLYINSDPVNAGNDAILAAIGKSDKDYSNSYSLHLGVNHKVTDKLELRGGSLFYTAAVPNDHFIPAVPDSNRLGLSLGTGYKFTKNLSLDVSYLNILNLRRKINNDISESLGTSVDGTYFSYLQELTISVTYKLENLFGSKEQIVKQPRKERPQIHFIPVAPKTVETNNQVLK